MTREESIAKLAQLRADAEESAREYNKAFADGKYDEYTKAKTDMDAKVNEYTSIAQTMCFDDCKASGDPMLAAVTALSFMTIGVKPEKIGEGENESEILTIVEKERAIDLFKLNNHCGGIGANKDWLHIAQKMNFLLTAQKCVDLGIDPKRVSDSYTMTEIARGFDMGKNPVSKTNLLKTLQVVITAMLGDGYKATSHDVNFLMSVYARKSRKALTVTCANHKYFRGYLAEVCHRIVTGKAYEVEFKAKKS